MKIYSHYNRPKHEGQENKGPSKTRQEFTKECNINNIVSKYHKTGVFEHEGGQGIFQDVSGYPSYQEALQFTINAQKSFMGLDVNLRKRFHNDPHELMEFLKDPSNKEEGQKIGLLMPDKKPAEPEPEILTEKKLKEALKQQAKDSKNQ